MAEPATGANDDRGRPASAPGMPRWVKVFGVVAGVLLLVFLALHLAGLRPVGHVSPGPHAGAAGTGGAAA